MSQTTQNEKDAQELFDSPPLDQRARSSFDFLGALSKTSQLAKLRAMEELKNSGAAADMEKADSAAERAELAETQLADCKALVWHEVLQNWRRRNHGPIAQQSFAALGQPLVDAINAYNDGTAALHPDPNLSPPNYWDNVEFHCTKGGWDGHDYMGYIHGEFVHKIMVNKIFAGGIFKQRRAVASLAPDDSYDRILEMGSSTGHFTLALQEVYPDAQITGIDLSIRGLEHALRVANRHGYTWQLHQRDACTTGFPDGSFDLVTSYIMLHEMPPKAVADAFKEAFRVVRPGGDLLFSDVARLHNLPALDSWWDDYFARHGGEPLWRASASLDLSELARKAGFICVEEKGLGPKDYPHAIIARKPE